MRIFVSDPSYFEMIAVRSERNDSLKSCGTCEDAKQRVLVTAHTRARDRGTAAFILRVMSSGVLTVSLM